MGLAPVRDVGDGRTLTAEAESRAPRRDHLGRDTHRDLLGRLGTDGQTDRRAQIGQSVLRHPQGHGAGFDHGNLAPTAYHAEIRRPPARGMPQHLEISPVASRDDDDEGAGRNLWQPLGEVMLHADQTKTFRMPARVQKARTIVDERDVEFEPDAQVGQRMSVTSMPASSAVAAASSFSAARTTEVSWRSPPGFIIT